MTTSSSASWAARREPPPLDADTVALFLLRPDRVAQADLARFQGWLNAEEAARLDRFRFAEHRREYLLGRALTRSVLGACLGLPPERVRFARLEHGKPVLADAGPAIHFNLSHAGGVNLLGVSRAGPVGVDVESHAPGRLDMPLAERFFHEEECRALRALDEAERGRALHALWTLKEALLKAAGCGLTQPLSGCRFRLDGGGVDGGAVAVEVVEALRIPGREWRCALLDLGEGLSGARAVPMPPGRVPHDLRIEWRP